jgi:hypothetical protein
MPIFFAQARPASGAPPAVVEIHILTLEPSLTEKPEVGTIVTPPKYLPAFVVKLRAFVWPDFISIVLLPVEPPPEP